MLLTVATIAPQTARAATVSDEYSGIVMSTQTIAIGYKHTLAIKKDGSLWAWGDNEFGQLGDGTTTSRLEPVKIMNNVVSISAAIQHSYAIKADGSLWAWGDNFRDGRNSPGAGRLGDGTDEHRLSPVKIMDGVAYVTAGPGITLAIQTDGSLWAWGIGLPSGSTNEKIAGSNLCYSGVPIKIMESVIAAYASQGTGNEMGGMAIKADGTLWIWGTNGFGQINGKIRENSSTPIAVMDSVMSASMGAWHSLAVKTDGSLWAWGSYQVTTYDFQQTPPESPVKIMDSVKFVSASTFQNSLVIKTDNSLWSFGRNYHGASGIGVDGVQNTPSKVMDNVTETVAGYSHSVALTADGSLWVWGSNYYGAFGNGIKSDNDSNKPTRVLDGIKLPTTPILSASPSKTSFLMNGQAVSVPEAYNVEDNNYLQLRGIATLLNGTAAQFDVTWDGTYAVIETGKPYSGTANPATLKDTTNVRRSTTQFKIDGAVVSFGKAYYIDGDTNYLQLREFAEKLTGMKSQFNVYWDGELSSAVIEPGKAYTGVK
jgi:alpha-tubulin suppressor-like RCC1 family protein